MTPEQRAAAAAENRARMPQVSEWLDIVRQAFPGATVSYASENGHVVGKPSPAGVPGETVIDAIMAGRGTPVPHRSAIMPKKRK